jgi:RING-type zinc-finger
MTTELADAELPEVVGNGDNIAVDCVNGDCATSSKSEFLACSLCHHRYVRPKLLPCLHTFCQQCIDSDTPAHSISVACPLCRHQSILPPDGIDSLHDNTYVAQMIKFIDQRLQCSICSCDGPAKCSAHGSCEGLQLSKLKLVINVNFFKNFSCAMLLYANAKQICHRIMLLAHMQHQIT